MNIEEVQRRLWEQSQDHKQLRESGTPLFPTNPYDGRIRNLMDLMHHPTWIMAACDRVLKRSRGKAAGVDGVRVHEFEKTRDHRLEQLRLELKRGTYQPLPLRRVEIPKANGKMRQLGIPCLRDKIVQEAIRMSLEPIFEVEFHANSYGFRPNRSAHHAVAQCRNAALGGFTWVIEGDVKACFDEISHRAILACVREKVMDNKFVALINRLLKAGVEIDGVVHPTTKGVPQGGIVSPLMANTVLNKLDWFLQSKGFYGTAKRRRSSHGLPNIRFCRYADDWCVFVTRGSRQYAERLRDEIRDFLQKSCGLELSDEKTRITHVRDGYDFLGFHISVGVGQSGRLVPKVKVGRKAIANIQLRLGPVSFGQGPSLSPNAGKHLGPSCPDFGGHSWLVELFQGSPQLLTSCSWAGPQGFLDRGKSDMSEGRYINCQMLPQVPRREHDRSSRGVYDGPLPGYVGELLLLVA